MARTTPSSHHPGLDPVSVRRPWALLLVLLVSGSLLVTAPVASGTPTGPSAAKRAAAQGSDVRELSPKSRFSTAKLPMRSAAQRRASAQAVGVTPAVGTNRQLIALDDYNGRLYRKTYTLQAVAAHIEVWVADDTAFPAGDCRAQVAGSTTVTRAQAESLAAQFESDMYPKESQAFSVAPPRDGSNALISGDYSGDGTKIMTLVDNVRDDNYFLGVNAAPTYIAGFFSDQFNALLDRNVMTVDAFDWAHRTGANPPDATTTDLCTSRPSRPFVYEATFAHEYQHLLHSYTDPIETAWVNEGLSDFAESLTGYGDATRTVFQRGGQSHIYCYQGFGTVQTTYNPNPRDCGGPENSLTLWGDQGAGNQILADYGQAWSFMLFLRDRYGLGFMSTLHRDGVNQGLVGVQRALDGYAPGTDVYTVLHDFQVSTLVDGIVGTRAGVVKGIAKARVTSASLNSTVNLGNPASYAAAGTPANGADYVALRARTGLYLDGSELRTLKFSGAKALVPEPLKWTSVTTAPGREGNATLWSGNSSNLDASAVTPITVPTANPTLTFTEKHLAEESYDYAYTVISSDGGRTYTPLANANTVTGPLGPALNGDAEGFVQQTFDLSAYAGKSVLLGFRYVSDGGVNDGGWYVDDVAVGGTAVSDGSNVTAFSSSTQVRPVAVYRYVVQVVGLDTAKHKALVKRYTGRSLNLKAADLAKFRSYPRVVVLVSYDDPTEQYQPKALYTLTANGVIQPGGGQTASVKARADRF